MPRHKNTEPALCPVDLPDVLEHKLIPPLALILGSPKEWLPLLELLQPEESDVTAYTMDLFVAEESRTSLKEIGLHAQVVAAPDLWDLPSDFQTAIYAPAPKGERELKIDMVEQAFHILRPHGSLIVISPYEADSFLPPLLKKVFRKVHTPAAGQRSILWSRRDGDRPRRRHEVTFQVRGQEEGRSLRFLSRPGVFSYGRLDNGARALVECAIVRPGDRVLDLGAGCGTNGIMASDYVGNECRVTFVDSNLRVGAGGTERARQRIEGFHHSRHLSRGR